LYSHIGLHIHISTVGVPEVIGMARIQVDEELVVKLDLMRSKVALRHLKENKKFKKVSNTDILNEALQLFAEKHGISIE
jgi:hypothetical protein